MAVIAHRTIFLSRMCLVLITVGSPRLLGVCSGEKRGQTVKRLRLCEPDVTFRALQGLVHVKFTSNQRRSLFFLTKIDQLCRSD